MPIKALRYKTPLEVLENNLKKKVVALTMKILLYNLS